MTQLEIPPGLWRDEAHNYFYGGNGPFASVTTVTGTLDKSAPLVGWAKRETAACAIRNHDMIGEMMPYIRRYAPKFRVYTVVWHRRRANEWQCATLMRDLKDGAGHDSTRCGPYHVVCTNCPNDEDRAITGNAGGEYWTYTFAISTGKITAHAPVLRQLYSHHGVEKIYGGFQSKVPLSMQSITHSRISGFWKR